MVDVVRLSRGVPKVVVDVVVVIPRLLVRTSPLMVPMLLGVSMLLARPEAPVALRELVVTGVLFRLLLLTITLGLIVLDRFPTTLCVLTELSTLEKIPVFIALPLRFESPLFRPSPLMVD